MATLKYFNSKETKKIKLIEKNSHKGDNGRVLVIGGSKLFHSASLWAAELLAHFVDLVFYYSPEITNQELFIDAKKQFRNGIIINEEELNEYVQEADVILIGPGMRRIQKECLDTEGKLTRKLVNGLLKKYPLKKWVIDAGALQELDAANIGDECLLTPHSGEFNRLFKNWPIENLNESELLKILNKVAESNKGTWLLKYQGIDYVFSKNSTDIIKINGGNEGLIKGGTGDLLAALVAVFFVKNNAMLSASCASFVLKKTAESIYEKQGPYFTTSELLAEIPKVFFKIQTTNY